MDFGRYVTYSDRNWHPHAKYRVGSVRDLARHVIPFFRTYPLFGRKRVAFEIFDQLVELLVDRQHTTEIGLERARHLAAQLSLHNSRGTERISPPR